MHGKPRVLAGDSINTVALSTLYNCARQCICLQKYQLSFINKAGIKAKYTTNPESPWPDWKELYVARLLTLYAYRPGGEDGILEIFML